jgi:TolB-like protein
LSFLNELKRRNVLRARIVVTVLAIGFPLFLLFSWVFEITPEGLKRETEIDRAVSTTHKTGKKLDRIIIVLLALALGYFAFDKFVLDPVRDAGELAVATQEAHQEGRSEALVESYGDKSIAVLPFVNMSDDPGNEYFSDGISEELLNLLAQIPELRVISRSSSFSFKGKDIAIPEIAKQLNVAHLLEGSVRKAGNRVRITAQLIDGRSDTHLWSDTYDRELDDIFAVQDEIAAAISTALKMKLKLVAGEVVQPEAIKAANTDAYVAYLQGRELIRGRGRVNMEGAVRHLERALRLDNNFAPAHAQLAIATLLYHGYSNEEARQTALVHLDRAQELEPDLAETHAGRALLALPDDLESAIEHARNALAVNPSYIDAMNWLHIGLRRLGRVEEAEVIRKQMLVTDPLSVIARLQNLGDLQNRGRTEEAHDLADQLLEQSLADQLLEQSLVTGYTAHADTSLWFEGKIAEGLSWALRVSVDNNNVMSAFFAVGEYEEARRTKDRFSYYADIGEGRWDEAIKAAQSNMQQHPDSGTYVAAAAEVLYYAGRFDEALALYERSLEYVPEGRPMLVPGWYSLVNTMRLALARRIAGDEEGAQAAAQVARQEHAARRTAGAKNPEQDLVEAMIAAFEHDPDHVITALTSAIQHGLWFMGIIDEAMFEDMRGEPWFVALRQELEAKLAAEHNKVLQLICFNNPVPDDWQPMPDTCEGVEEQHGL